MYFKISVQFLVSSIFISTTVGNPDIIEQQNVLDRLKDIEAVVKLQQLDNVRLKEENKALVLQQARLGAENKDLIGEIYKLRSREERQHARIERLEKIIVANAADKDIEFGRGISNTNKTLEERIEDITNVSNKGQNKHGRIRQVYQDQQIFFFATRTAHSQHLGQNQPVVFDNAINNIGNAYHPTAGIFTAPVDGVYVFSATLLLYQEDAHFEFTVNGKVFSVMFSSRADTYETLSQTVIFSLAKGDDVAIIGMDSDKFVHGGHYSTFTGFLLYAN